MLDELKGRSPPLREPRPARPSIFLPSPSLIAELSRWVAGAPWLEELDLNPVIANADGFVVVDVRMRVSAPRIGRPALHIPNTEPEGNIRHEHCRHQHRLSQAKQTPEEAAAEIEAMVARARVAQQAIENYTQDEADALVTAVGWHVFKNREALARLAIDEGGFGRYQDKVAKFENRVMGTLADMAGIKTCGVVEEIPEKGLVKIAKPVGVIAALIPTTGPDATPPVKALGALKARNAIIVSPHPRTKRTSIAVVEAMRQGCREVGAPEDLIQVIEQPSIAKTEALMRLADLVVATGGAGMVKAAYSSGTPAYGVGVGNSVHVVDETADLDDAALMIARAKTFDYATSCLADNSVVAESGIYAALLAKLIAAGGYLCTPEQKEQLARAMWPDGGHIPTIDVVAKPASHIAELAGFDLPSDRSFLIVEEDGVGAGPPVLRREALGGARALSLFRRHRCRHRSGEPHHRLSGPRPHLRHPHDQRRQCRGARHAHQDREGAGQSEPERGRGKSAQRHALHAVARLRHAGAATSPPRTSAPVIS